MRPPFGAKNGDVIRTLVNELPQRRNSAFMRTACYLHFIGDMPAGVKQTRLTEELHELLKSERFGIQDCGEVTVSVNYSSTKI